MLILKIVIYIAIFASSSYVGILFSRKYSNRVNELKDFKNAFNIFKTKLRYTYAPLNEIFMDISKSIKGIVGETFLDICNSMKIQDATESFNSAIDTTNLNLTVEDKETIKNLSKLLGKTDIEGQLSQIDLCISFLNVQIEKAEREKEKNEKLYKTLGIITGLGIIIVLM